MTQKISCDRVMRSHDIHEITMLVMQSRDLSNDGKFLSVFAETRQVKKIEYIRLTFVFRLFFVQDREVT